VNCYAERIAARFSDPGHPFHLFAEYRRAGSKWTGKVELVESVLMDPLRWRKPRRVFVNSMSDLFHENLPLGDTKAVFRVMAKCQGHTFQILTKRADLMRERLQNRRWRNFGHCPDLGGDFYAPILLGEHRETDAPFLPNVWLGVSVEDRKRKDRIDHLRETPAAIRFLSIEPLLEELFVLDLRGIHWVICGGESGPGARPMHPEWVRSVRDQCNAAGVPFFFKQWGAWREPVVGDRYNTINGRANKPPAFLVSPDGTVHCSREASGSEAAPMLCVGKKATGRILDGRTWNEFPKGGAR
jgi:protein gp37